MNEKEKFFAKECKNKNVLDIGIVQHNIDNFRKDNWLHRVISQNSKNCLGIDIDKKGIDFLQKRGYTVIYSDAQYFELREKFDLICAGDLIEHLSNPGLFLERARQHLHRNGYLIISTPNVFYWKYIASVILKQSARPNPQHTCWYCEDTIKQLLRRHNYIISKIMYCSVYNFESKLQRIGKTIHDTIPMPKKIKENTILLKCFPK